MLGNRLPFGDTAKAVSTSRSPMFTMVGAMLNRDFAKVRPGDRPVLNSDQGWHCQMDQYHQRLRANAAAHSMSRKGNCLDNAVVGSFFGTPQSEYFHFTRSAACGPFLLGLLWARLPTRRPPLRTWSRRRFRRREGRR